MKKIEDVKLLSFKQCGDDRGALIVVEGNSDIPFDINRIFYMYGTDKTAIRGQHANRDTEFVLINIAGSCKVDIKDGHGNKLSYVLDNPWEGVYIPNMLWKDMYDFSEDSMLLVIASKHYNSEEYIRCFDTFVKEVSTLEDRK